MTAPLAAFPPMAPIAAPFAAPLALGWEVVCVAAGGVCGGGVCASAAGTTAPESAIRRDITLAECFIMASFLVLSSDPPCGSSEATRPTIGDRLHCPVVAFLSCEVGFAEPNIQTSWRIHLDGITS